MKKIAFLILFFVSCSHFSVSPDYVKALILKAENERNPFLLREAFQKAGEDTDLIARIAIASGRIPDFYTYQKIAKKFPQNERIADNLAIASMFPQTNFPTKKLVKILGNISFTQRVVESLLNTRNILALNIVLNRDKLLNHKYAKEIGFNLWRAGKIVKGEVLEQYYKLAPAETSYSLYRLKVKGIAKAKDLQNADLNFKFYAMFVVDNLEKLLDKSVWQLKVAYIKASNSLKVSKEFLSDANPLVRQTALTYYLKNGGKISRLNLDKMKPSCLEIVLPYLKDGKKVANLFKKGGFYAYVCAPYMDKTYARDVMNSQIPFYQKLKFVENAEGEDYAVKEAVKIFKQSGDYSVLCYLIEKYEESRIDKEIIISLVRNNQRKYLSLIVDAGFVKIKPEKKPLAYYVGALKKAENIKGFVIETDAGDVDCKFYPEFAPLTCLNFYNLAKKGYFNGTFFHRVIPGFVAQGGDPYGTGYGGPDYTIRCEYNELTYNNEGVIGMALAGKDTGGSQFFITHIATPHLNYKYTIFARVLKGNHTLARLTRFTKIEKVVIKD